MMKRERWERRTFDIRVTLDELDTFVMEAWAETERKEVDAYVTGLVLEWLRAALHQFKKPLDGDLLARVQREIEKQKATTGRPGGKP